MKSLIDKKTGFLVLFLLLMNGELMTQSTDALLGALTVIFFVILALVLLMLIMLIMFIIRRTRVLGIVNMIFGFFLFFAGVGISAISGDYHSSEFELFSNCLKIAGVMILALVFIFLKIIPRKRQENENTQTISESVGEPATKVTRMVRWLSLLLALWFLYDLNLAFEFWSLTSSNSWDENFGYSLVQILPLIFLLVTLYLISTHKWVGWVMFVFYLLYTIAGYIMYILRTSVLLPADSNFEVPLSMRIIQLSVIIIFSVCLGLILREDVRAVFSVTKKSAFMTVFISVLITVFIIMALNFLLSR